jgi:hypothetical protein
MTDLGIEGRIKGTNHRPAELIRQLDRTSEPVIKEDNTAKTACGQSGFSDDSGMTTSSEK